MCDSVGRSVVAVEDEDHAAQTQWQPRAVTSMVTSMVISHDALYHLATAIDLFSLLPYAAAPCV